MADPDTSALPTRRAGVAPGASSAAIAAYGDLRTRVTDLLGGLDAEQARRAVPACPDWTVTETLAHVVGVCVDIVEGNIGDEVATPAWADGHVARHRDLGVDGLLARWQDTAPTIDTLGGLVPDDTASQFVFDATTHEHDVRGALGRPGGRDAASVTIGLGFLESRLDALVVARDLPPLLITTDTERIQVGEGPAATTLRASHFDLLRAFGGRRSVAQIRAMDWEGDPGPYLAVFEAGPLRPPEADVVE